MNKIMFVTFPRSGHFPLIKSLYCVLGDEFKFCNFYNHCNKVGCNKECNAQKNHDFDLSLKIPKGWIPIIQIRRNERDNLYAWYNLVSKERKINKKNFINEKRLFLKKWKEKWLTQNYKVIYYEDFLLNIKDTALNVAEMIKPGISTEIDNEKIIRDLIGLQIYYKNFY
jgi:hypothetical protein